MLDVVRLQLYNNPNSNRKGIKNMKTFKIGKTYTMRSACDHNCVWSFEVIRRTAKSVWLVVDGKESRFNIKIWGDEETVKPLGNYSMCPILGAQKEAA